MSFARQMAHAGQFATAVIEEDIVQNLRTGISFMAKLALREDLVLTDETGLDPRASAVLYVRRELNIDIQAQDVISGLDAQFTVLPMSAPEDAITIHRKYLVIKVEPGLDT